MNHTHSSLRLHSAAILGAACVLILVTGCANMVNSNPSSFLSSGGVMQGTMYGGNQPVTGATVDLWSQGTSGYGSQGTRYATTTTDNVGGFAFSQTASTPGPGNPLSNTYACPASGDPQMYLRASGGNPGAGNNTAAAALVAIGPCSKVASLFIDMNEVTTVATMAALQQYFNPSTNTLGSPNTTQALLGFANAQAGIATMVDIAHGAAFATSTPASSVTGVTVTATIENKKLNTLANILAACVDTTGNCSTLFTNATPQTPSLTSTTLSTFPTPTDVVQAAYYMLTNPTESQDNGSSGKLSKLFALSTPTSPFQPSLSVAPLDWTIAIQYSPGSQTCPGGGRFFTTTMKSVAIDASGNIWANGGSSSANALVELSPTGGPLQCDAAGTLPTGLGLTIDPTGNVWSASASSIYEVRPAGSTPSTLTWTASTLSGIAADNAGNIFYAPTGGTALQEYVGASSATAAFASTSVGSSTTNSGTFFYLTVDGLGRVLAPGSSGANFTDLYPSTTGTGSVHGYTYADIGSTSYQANSYGGAVDSSNNFFGGNTCCAGTLNNTFYKLTIPAPATVGATPVVTVVNSAKYLGGLVGSRSEIVDGAGNVWAGMLDPVLNMNTSANPPIPADVYAIAEITNDLQTGISPNGVTPATCSSTGPNCQTDGGFQHTGLATVVSLAIDPSGNVWALSQTGTTLVEIVGQAVPVVTPLVVSPGVKP